VSIGLPVYNGENYLSAALDSILKQTFADFELIISDNASTDITQEICQRYAGQDERIIYTRTKINIGAAKNYNLLLEYAKGEFFKWAAHDDLIDPMFLEKCVNVLDHEPDVVLTYPQTILYDLNGNAYGEYADGLNLSSQFPYERFLKFLENPGLCHAVFGLIRLKALKKTTLIGNYPRSDRNLLGELSLYGKFYEIPESLFFRRTHPRDSTTVNVTEYELAVWFDPSKEGKMVFPRWRRLYEYLKAIIRAPMSIKDKYLCISYLGRFSFDIERWRGMFEDIIVALKQKFPINFLQKSKK